MRRQLLPALRALAVLTLLFGLAYPFTVTAVAQLAFPFRSDGSLVERDGRTVGSELLGQAFSDPAYLHPRPSAAGAGYDAAASSGSNLGPTNPELLAAVEERVDAYRRLNGLDDLVPVPVDAVTASGSGLDPHITVANARLQAPRIAAARGITPDEVLAVIDAHTRHRELGILGDEAVNVLTVNIALDALGE